MCRAGGAEGGGRVAGRCSTHLASRGCPSRALHCSSRLRHRFSSSPPRLLLLSFPGMKDESDTLLGERGQVGGVGPHAAVPAAQQLL